MLKNTILLLVTLLISTNAFSFSNAQVAECSGAVFKMKGMSPSRKALVVSNAHCLGPYLASTSSNKLKEDTHNGKGYSTVMLFKHIMDLGNIYNSSNNVFTSILSTDLSILELDLTYAQLSELNYKVYEISDSPLKLDDKLEFNSLFKQNESMCTVEKKVSLLKEGPMQTRNSYRLMDEAKCALEHGNSGTVGVRDGKIAAIAFTRVDAGVNPCKVNSPCEIEEGETKTAKKNQAYVLPLNFLYSCYNAKTGQFDFKKQECKDAYL